MQNNLTLASLTGSRLCHDLISPIGAIGNGLELLKWAGTPETPELALIKESVESAQARISFFRIAFGPSPADQTRSGQTLLKVMKNYVATTRNTLSWTPLDEIDAQHAKLTFLLVMCLEHSLLHGGQIEVSDDGRHITGRSKTLSTVNSVWAILEGAAPDKAAEVQFALAANHAASIDAAISVEKQDDHIKISF